MKLLLRQLPRLPQLVATPMVANTQVQKHVGIRFRLKECHTLALLTMYYLIIYRDVA